MADILATLYTRSLRLDAANPRDPSRDRFILSKGHATAILYRRMSSDAPAAMYELRLRKDSGTWMVAGETVTPWPGGIDGNFLPPRQKAA